VIDNERNIKGSSARDDFIFSFLNRTMYREYNPEDNRKTYMYPKYNSRLTTILSPNSTSISPIPNGFFINLAIRSIKTHITIPPITAFSGIE
jgi:hypothetical protein